MEKMVRNRILSLLTVLAVFFGMLPDMFGVAFAEETPSARVEVDDWIGSVEIGKEMPYPQNITITLVGDTFKNLVVDEDVLPWFKDNCMPKGIKAQVSEAPTGENTVLKIKITGTPTERKFSLLSIEIPSDKLTKGGNIKVEKNGKAMSEFGRDLIQLRERISNERRKCGDEVGSYAWLSVELRGNIKFKATETTEDVTSWFCDVPPGISIALTENVAEGAATAKFKASGHFTSAGFFTMYPEIPKDKLTGVDWLKETKLAPLESEIEENNVKFGVEPTVTISGPGFVGEQGQALSSNEVIIRVEGDTFKESDISAKWLTNLCNKMRKKAELSPDKTEVRITVEGTPQDGRDRDCIRASIPYTAFENYSRKLPADDWQSYSTIHIKSDEHTCIDIYWGGDAGINDKPTAERSYDFDWDDDSIMGVPEGNVADLKADLWTSHGGEFKVVGADVTKIESPQEYENAQALDDNTPIEIGQKVAVLSPNKKGTKLWKIISMSPPEAKRADLHSVFEWDKRDENPSKGSGAKDDPIIWNIDVANSYKQFYPWEIHLEIDGAKRALYKDSTFESSEREIKLEEGKITKAYVTVTSPDKSVTKYYVINIRRAAEKSSNTDLERIYHNNGIDIESKSEGGETKENPAVWNIKYYDTCEGNEKWDKGSIRGAEGAKVKLYSDSSFSNEVEYITLNENGRTPIYVKVEAENGDVKYYTLNVTHVKDELDTRLRRVFKKRIETGLQLGTQADPKKASIVVDGAVSKITKAKISARSKKFELYSDDNFTNKVEELGLKASETTTAYIKVISRDSGVAPKYYAISILRGQAEKSKDASLSTLIGENVVTGTEAGTQDAPKSITINVLNSITKLEKKDISTKDGNAKATLYSDKFMTAVETIDLTQSAETKAYIKVEAEDTSAPSMHYEVTIKRTQEKLKDAEIVTIFKKQGTDKGSRDGKTKENAITLKVGVDNAVSKLDAAKDIIVSKGAKAELFRDKDFTESINELNLTEGIAVTAYIKVTAESGDEKYYAVDITRQKKAETPTPPSGGHSGKKKNKNSNIGAIPAQPGDQAQAAVIVKNEAAKALVTNITDQAQANHIDKLVENKPMTEKKEAIKALTPDTKAKLAAAILPKYTDVKADAWYAKDLAVVMTSGLIKGTGDNTVSPTKNVTGKEMMAMLVRSMGKDVKENKDANWYEAYKTEATALKLDEGIKFNIEKDLTRAEVATMMFRYVKLNEKSPSDVDVAVLEKIKDMKDIPEEYKEAVAYMYQKGLLKGYEDGSFAPNKTLTRVEVATILARLLAM